jgi:hypothetical protein
MIRRKIIIVICACNFLLGTGLYLAKSLWMPDTSGFGEKFRGAALDAMQTPFQLHALSLSRPGSPAERARENDAHAAKRNINAEWKARSDMLVGIARVERQFAWRTSLFFYIALGMIGMNTSMFLMLLILFSNGQAAGETPVALAGPNAASDASC